MAETWRTAVSALQALRFSGGCAPVDVVIEHDDVSSTQARRFRWFITAWSLGTLIHFTKPGNATVPSFDFGTGWSTPTGVVAALTAALVAMFPRHFSLIAVALAAQLVDYWVALPVVATSATFRAIGSATLLLAFGHAAIRGRRMERGAVDVIPLLRLEYCTLWVAAVFHKLNAPFLDPATSDAARVFKSVPIPIPRLLQPGLTLAFESAIAVALSMRRSRGLGIVLALAFALQTGFGGIIQFAAVSLAMVILFLSDEVVAALPSPIPASWRRALGESGARAVVVMVPLVAFTAGAINPRRIGLAVLIGWLWFAVGLVAAIALARRRSSRLGTESLGLRAFPAALVIAAAIANEAGPYLGTKDWPVFSMYSNSAPAECGAHLIFRAPLIRTPASELLYVHDGGTVGVSKGSFATESTLRLRLNAYSRMGARSCFVRIGRDGSTTLRPDPSPFTHAPLGRFFYDYPALPEEIACYR